MAFKVFYKMGNILEVGSVGNLTHGKIGIAKLPFCLLDNVLGNYLGSGLSKLVATLCIKVLGGSV